MIGGGSCDASSGCNCCSISDHHHYLYHSGGGGGGGGTLPRQHRGGGGPILMPMPRQQQRPIAKVIGNVLNASTHQQQQQTTCWHCQRFDCSGGCVKKHPPDPPRRQTSVSSCNSNTSSPNHVIQHHLMRGCGGQQSPVYVNFQPQTTTVEIHAEKPHDVNLINFSSIL